MAKVNVLNTVSCHRQRWRRVWSSFVRRRRRRSDQKAVCLGARARYPLSVYRYRVTHAASVNINIQKKKIHGFYVCFGAAMEGKWRRARPVFSLTVIVEKSLNEIAN